MKRVAKFEKVSYKQFTKDWIDTFGAAPDDNVKIIYDKITEPKRGTKGSAGYDFVSPVEFKLAPGGTIKIPTGIRCSIDTDWVLMLFPRSSIGFKYNTRLNNTVGIVDSDYYFSDNEGHIFVKLSNQGDKTLSVSQGDKFVQGIFTEYGITEDDHVEESRNGGMGSTGK